MGRYPHEQHGRLLKHYEPFVTNASRVLALTTETRKRQIRDLPRRTLEAHALVWLCDHHYHPIWEVEPGRSSHMNPAPIPIASTPWRPPRR